MEIYTRNEWRRLKKVYLSWTSHAAGHLDVVKNAVAKIGLSAVIKLNIITVRTNTNIIFLHAYKSRISSENLIPLKRFLNIVEKPKTEEIGFAPQPKDFSLLRSFSQRRISAENTLLSNSHLFLSACLHESH